MTAQDKIQQLAMAALRSAPSPAGAPKPSTFMADPEKLRAIPTAAPIEPTAKAEPAAPVTPSMPVTEAGLQPEAKPFKDEGCPELRAMIEERDATKEKSHKRKSLAVTCSLLAMLAALGGWFAVSPSAQAKVAKIVPLMKASVQDVKSLANTKKNFDKQLEKIGNHGNQIADATRAMGVDPDSVPKGNGEEIDGAMKSMSGGQRTTTERNKDVQDKLGFVGKLLGNKTPGAEAQPEAK
ncbi:hypothetical protein [Luteolibacter soli]|uniref:Uncharacterized protein n=1 Tax=Luteolibacter soli TaxID=3135280 RepID=A0ABU9B0A7_9BACT